MPSLEALTRNREAYVKLAEIDPLFDSMAPLDKMRIMGDNVLIVQTFEHGIMYRKEYGPSVYYMSNEELLSEVSRYMKSWPTKKVIRDGWYTTVVRRKGE